MKNRTNIDSSVIELYRKEIPLGHVEKAFKVFFLTKDEKIREQLIIHFIPKVISIAKKYNYHNLFEEEDIEQMALEFLIWAVDTYNPFDFNQQFPHYLNLNYYRRCYYSKSYNYLLNMYYTEKENKEKELNRDLTEEEKDEIVFKIINWSQPNSQKHQSVTFDAFKRRISVNESLSLDDIKDLKSKLDVDNCLIGEESKVLIKEKIDELDDRNIIKYRYGFINDKPLTCREISEKINVSQQRVSAIEKYKLDRIKDEFISMGINSIYYLDELKETNDNLNGEYTLRKKI